MNPAQYVVTDVDGLMVCGLGEVTGALAFAVGKYPFALAIFMTLLMARGVAAIPNVSAITLIAPERKYEPANPPTAMTYLAMSCAE